VHYYYFLLTTVTFTNLFLHARLLLLSINCIVWYFKGVYSDTTQLNSTRRPVELCRYKHPFTLRRVVLFVETGLYNKHQSCRVKRDLIFFRGIIGYTVITMKQVIKFRPD